MVFFFTRDMHNYIYKSDASCINLYLLGQCQMRIHFKCVANKIDKNLGASNTYHVYMVFMFIYHAKSLQIF